MNEKKEKTGWYGGVCIGVVHVAVALVLLNAVCGLYFRAKDRKQAGQTIVALRYSTNVLAASYPDLSLKQVNELLDETWNRRLFEYEPFVQIREKAFTGRYLNVDAHGFRRTKNQGPWPPDPDAFNIFLFGCSVVFGYGVPDDQTLASHLQDVLVERTGRDIRLYNFGRGFYFSTLERLLIEKLLLAGHRPDLALFVDGSNDFADGGDEPFMTARIRQLVENFKQDDQIEFDVFKWLQQQPLVRLFRAMKSPQTETETRSDRRQKKKPPRKSESRTPESDPLAVLIEQYMTNKKMTEAICHVFSVPACFVWAPNAYYKYDLKYHPFANPSKLGRRERIWAKGHERMAAYVQANPPGSNFIWCADIQEDVKEQLYVDSAHYTSRMARRLAETIADDLTARGLVPPPRPESLSPQADQNTR
ncbi:MAG: SGNH/GDSL hydrolase family protein [Verrucomicrobia bacterium]|nr:SGNH/GDSL hydrolase family protein [Verrucomicrobiota bacterium]